MEQTNQNASSPDRDGRLRVATARGLAAFLGGFTLLNILGEFRHQGFDASIWWVDLRPLPSGCRLAVLAGLTLTTLQFAWRPAATGMLTAMRIIALVPVLAFSIRDTAFYFQLQELGQIKSAALFPFSAVVLTCLCVLLAGYSSARNHRAEHWRMGTIFALTIAGLCLAAFPLLQIHCFGQTDYRRRADAAVVFGCRVYSNGDLSPALADRVHRGCELYHRQLVGYLVMSGGPGPGPVHETDAMRLEAMQLGIPADCILVDRTGHSTDHTVFATMPLFKKRGFRRILAVSHSFHLPRIKLTYSRAGLDVFTVPVSESVPLPNRTFQLAREVVALWAYYLRPVTGL